jgi:hypothetical protein
LVRFRVNRVAVHNMPTNFGRVLPDASPEVAQVDNQTEGDSDQGSKTQSNYPEGPELSDRESELRDDHRQFFAERVRDNLGKVSIDVRLLATAPEDSVHPMHPLVRGQLADEADDFLEMSQKAAWHLHHSQSRRNTSGLLVVLQGQIGSQAGASIPCVGFLKLERQKGMRVKESMDAGVRRFDVETVRDLMLTEKMTVFKAALFSQHSDWGDEIVGLVCDLQKPRQIEVADFFMGRFLGCQRAQVAEVATEQMHTQIAKWIDEKVSDPVVQVGYHMDLTSQMQSNATIFSPTEFIADHLQDTDRASLREYLATHNVALVPIEKNTALIEHKLKKVTLEYRSGLKVVGSSKAIGDLVEFSVADDGTPITIIQDEVQGVGH